MHVYTQLIKMMDGLLPRRCVLCCSPTQHTHSFCNPCLQGLPILPQSCQQCARFLPFNQPKCGGCLKQSPAFDQTYALFPYEPPLPQIITRLKFLHQLIYAKALGELIAERIKTVWYLNQPLPDLIIPIPLHAQRLRERGFNQALEIARPIARALNLPIDYQGVKRTKATVAQSGLQALARKENISHAFSVTRDYRGLTLALIDDVITTGHTVMECSKMLKNNGAARIEIWCCARNG